MPIKIVRSGSDKWTPAIFYDVCGDIIPDAELGAAVWADKVVESGKETARFVHKGPCHDSLDARARNGWTDLDLFLYRLCLSLALDADKLRERAEKLSGFED